MRQRVLDWLDDQGGFESCKAPLMEKIPISAPEENIIFGETLPPGILMHDASMYNLRENLP